MALNLVFLIYCRKHKAFWIPVLRQVSQHAWGCVIRHQAAFPCLTGLLEPCSVTAPCSGCAVPRGTPAPCGSAHTRALMDGPVLMSSEGNHMEPSLLEAQTSEGGS